MSNRDIHNRSECALLKWSTSNLAYADYDRNAVFYRFLPQNDHNVDTPLYTKMHIVKFLYNEDTELFIMAYGPSSSFYKNWLVDPQDLRVALMAMIIIWILEPPEGF